MLHEQIALCAEANADFAAGVLMMSLSELLILRTLLERRKQITYLAEYKSQFQDKSTHKIKQAFRRKSLLDRILSLNLDSLMRFSKEMNLITSSDLNSEDKALLKGYGYTADLDGLLVFLRETRNQLHLRPFKSRALKMRSQGKANDISAWGDYHFNFAVLAFRFKEAILRGAERDLS